MRTEISEKTLCQDLDGEMVLLSLRTGVYYTLSGVGARMWRLLAEHGRLEPVVQALREEYDVPEDRLREDLLALVEDLASRRLIRVFR